MNLPQIVFVDEPSYLTHVAIEELRTIGSIQIFEDRPDVEALSARLDAADIAVVEWSSLPREVFDSALRVKHIIVPTTGYKRIDVEAARARGIVVSNTPDYCRQSVAEYVFALILTLSRNLFDNHAKSIVNPQIDYMSLAPGIELYTKTIGIVGMGGIGTWVAKIAQGFDMRVLAYNRSRVRMPGVEQVELKKLVEKSDFLVCCIAVREETQQILTAEVLRNCKNGVVIASISGPNLFDVEALVELLGSGAINAVGLDSQQDERLGSSAARLLQTPDCAWYTSEALERNLQSVIETIRQSVLGEYRNVV